MKISKNLEKNQFLVYLGEEFVTNGGFFCLRYIPILQGFQRQIWTWRRIFSSESDILSLSLPPHPASASTHPFGVSGCRGWVGGLYEKGAREVCLSFYIWIWTQIGDFSETGGLRSNIFWLWEHFYLEIINLKGVLGLLWSKNCLYKKRVVARNF